VTTNAAVSASSGSNAACTLAATFAASISGGGGATGNLSPIGQSWAAGSGSDDRTRTGVKNTERDPRGSVTQP
jgi:hypothetical protein